MGRRSKKRAARASRSTRHHGPDSSELGISQQVVGWVAQDDLGLLLDGDAIVVAGSEPAIQRAAGLPPGAGDFRPLSFDVLFLALQYGRAYAFDQAAYKVFLPLAREYKLPLATQDNGLPGPGGLRLIRIELDDTPFDFFSDITSP